MGYNQGKNKMSTTKKNGATATDEQIKINSEKVTMTEKLYCKLQEKEFPKEKAIILKVGDTKTDPKGNEYKNLTFAVFETVTTHSAMAVFKSVIRCLTCDELTTMELQANFGKVKDEETQKATALDLQAAKISRLVGSFSKDWIAGYSNENGHFMPVMSAPATSPLRSVLGLNFAAVKAIATANCKERKNLVFSYADRAIGLLSQTDKYLQKVHGFATAQKLSSMFTVADAERQAEKELKAAKERKEKAAKKVEAEPVTA